ncbi:MAG: hypothetical protein R3E03_02815 [Novosphingobium sp.]
MADANDLYGSVVSATKFNAEYQMSFLGKPVDHKLWVNRRLNAYNGGLLNQIVFPAGILQAPFFDPAPTWRSTRRDRRGDRARDQATVRRSGPQDRRERRGSRLVDPRRCRALQRAEAAFVASTMRSRWYPARTSIPS